MMITLTGLTPQDTLICDLLWSCPSKAAVDAMITAMPLQHQTRAGLMLELMIASAFDEHMEVTDEVADYIGSL